MKNTTKMYVYFFSSSWCSQYTIVQWTYFSYSFTVIIFPSAQGWDLGNCDDHARAQIAGDDGALLLTPGFLSLPLFTFSPDNTQPYIQLGKVKKKILGRQKRDFFPTQKNISKICAKQIIIITFLPPNSMRFRRPIAPKLPPTTRKKAVGLYSGWGLKEGTKEGRSINQWHSATVE